MLVDMEPVRRCSRRSLLLQDPVTHTPSFVHFLFVHFFIGLLKRVCNQLGMSYLHAVPHVRAMDLQSTASLIYGHPLNHVQPFVSLCDLRIFIGSNIH